MPKKTKKIEKKAVRRVWTEGVGGLAEAAGKVRKGKPSGTGRLNASIQNHASTPLGYGELKTLARDRRTLGWLALQMGLPTVFAGFFQEFCRGFPAFASTP